MKRYIMCWFSVRVSSWKAPFNTEAERDDWFAYRAQLFQYGLLKCVRAQQGAAADGIMLVMDEGDRQLFEKISRIQTL